MERESFIKLGYYFKDNNVGGHFGSHIYCSKHYFFKFQEEMGIVLYEYSPYINSNLFLKHKLF